VVAARSALPIPEILRVRIAIAKRIVDKNSGLAGQFDALPAFVARHQVVQAHHVRCSLRKLVLVFSARPSRQFPALRTDFPSNGRREFIPAAGADELLWFGFFFFCVKRSLFHNYGAGALTAPEIVTNSRPASRQRGSQFAKAARVPVLSAFNARCPPSCKQIMSPALSRAFCF
jgi:hypothetical protein